MPAPVHRAAPAFPVSVKGVAVQGGRVLLLENERNEWELPGGKLELCEEPADCVVREIREEAGWEVTAGPLLDCWQYYIREGADVVIVTYGCHVLSTDPPLVSNEHRQVGLFTLGEVPDLVMPVGYKRSIAAWLTSARGMSAAGHSLSGAECGHARLGRKVLDGMIGSMTRLKIAITLPEEQVAAARQAVAEGRAASVSAFISQALARRDADEEMADTIAEIYAESGQPTEEDRIWARRVLGIEP